LTSKLRRKTPLYRFLGGDAACFEAITQAGYRAGTDVGPALDPAAGEFFDASRGKYVFKKSDNSKRQSEQMVEFWSHWVRRYPIISIEDGMAEDDRQGWKLKKYRQNPTPNFQLKKGHRYDHG
jgi:enolase